MPTFEASSQCPVVETERDKARPKSPSAPHWCGTPIKRTPPSNATTDPVFSRMRQPEFRLTSVASVSVRPPEWKPEFGPWYGRPEIKAD